MGYLLDLGVKNSFMTLQATKRFKIKTKLVANPIMVQLAQGIARPSLSVVLGVKLFCG
jgi:hypothetical protein